ncbi:MAG TPA: hypothetical protein VFX86_04845 [Candidatus Saccharimonadales bacterium]|nr:hypothetical protein [Candidatus Saccharimonadales bacterium]
MSERDLINKRVEAILKQRRQEESRAVEAVQQRRDKEERKTSRRKQDHPIERIAGQFAIWATKHEIPRDIPNVKALLLSHGTFKGLTHRIKTGPAVPAWNIASTQEGASGSGGSGFMTLKLAVDSSANLYTSPVPSNRSADSPGGWWLPVDAVEDENLLLPFQPDMVYDTIAELCVEHDIEWDVPQAPR